LVASFVSAANTSAEAGEAEIVLCFAAFLDLGVVALGAVAGVAGIHGGGGGGGGITINKYRETEYTSV